MTMDELETALANVTAHNTLALRRSSTGVYQASLKNLTGMVVCRADAFTAVRALTCLLRRATNTDYAEPTPETVAEEIVLQMTPEERAGFEIDAWREGVSAMLFGQWRGLPVDDVLRRLDELCAELSPLLATARRNAEMED
jgi:hypothetical protein